MQLDEMRVCRKCLIPDYIQDRETFLHISFEKMPETERVDNEEYERRLDQCNLCKNLINGMCSICGCFVLIRAAGRKSYCPATPEKW